MINPEYMAEFYTNPRGPMLIALLAILLLNGLLSLHWTIHRSMQD
jgi:Flp pilus assembly protein TadB